MAPASRSSAPAAALPRRLPTGGLRGVRLPQVVACQVAAAGVLLSLAGPRWAVGAGGGAAAALLALTMGRRRGRWLYQSLGSRTFANVDAVFA